MIVIADTSSLISLIVADKLFLIEKTIGPYYIPNAVWNELNNYSNPSFDKKVLNDIKHLIKEIKTTNYLHVIMDLGESEAVTLYNEINANYLLIDDNKARQIAESLGVNCIGSIGILIKSKELSYITNLRDTFKIWHNSGRFFSKKLLNDVLTLYDEEII